MDFAQFLLGVSATAGLPSGLLSLTKPTAGLNCSGIAFSSPDSE
jgi:hypothetical protein